MLQQTRVMQTGQDTIKAKYQCMSTTMSNIISKKLQNKVKITFQSWHGFGIIIANLTSN